MAREINLVPDIKTDMIKAIKLRNLIFFLSIVVAAASIGVTVLAGLTASGQQIAVDGKKSTIEKLSQKITSYSDLKDFLTIRDQLGNIASLTSNKKVLSRTFNALSAIIPTGADTIKISELNVDLGANVPTFSFDAQANAGQEPFIDYNVLDAFKKSMKYMRYDYGKYVDKDGNTIPAYCMIENSNDGSLLHNDNNDLFAYWTIDEDGCYLEDNNSSATNDSSSDLLADDASVTANVKPSSSSGYTTEDYNGKKVVRVWRTPQFESWYKESPSENEPYMDLSGNISNVPHFESSCITYTGNNDPNSNSIKWSDSNETCLLIPGGEDAIQIYDSSNGMNENDELVLRFSAVLTFAPEFFKFENTHMLAKAPSGRRNVTDSYVQIQAIFGERAADCNPNDTACSSTQNNGQNNSNQNNNNQNNNNQGGGSDNQNNGNNNSNGGNN